MLEMSIMYLIAFLPSYVCQMSVSVYLHLDEDPRLDACLIHLCALTGQGTWVSRSELKRPRRDIIRFVASYTQGSGSGVGFHAGSQKCVRASSRIMQIYLLLLSKPFGTNMRLTHANQQFVPIIFTPQTQRASLPVGKPVYQCSLAGYRKTIYTPQDSPHTAHRS